MKKSIFPVMFFVTAGGLRSQTPANGADTLRSLMEEVHQLRLDIEAMTIASQRVQIAVSAVQMQDAVVARASQGLESAGNKCIAQEEARQHSEKEIQNLESELANGANESNRVRSMQAYVTQLKSGAEAQASELRACQAAEAQASSQLRTEQAKLTDLQDRLARLDRNLEQISGPAK